ncbi:MAG TPA: hypothetical protein VLH77_02110, partial [Gammaproteobacteria bacterium]|nr:hypothetical protein [Gammaproteobacteria bacterium]
MQRQEQPSPLEKKGVLVDDLQGRSTLVLNSQGDNRDLSGTTSAGPGPLCAFIGSYNAFNPHVLAYVKLPLGIENHLKLRAPLTAEHSVEVYYNLQERLIFTGDERISKPDPFYSLIGHYVVFSEAAMLAARENVEQKINQQEEKSKNEAKEALEVAAEQEIIEEIGELEFLLLPEKERQQMVAQRMTAHMTAESVESRTVKVLAYHGINGESIEFLSGKNNRLILHSTYLSPDEFHLE